MNYDELVTAYEADVQFPGVSGMEHLDMLIMRSEIARVTPSLPESLNKRVLRADRKLISQASQFYAAIQTIADLASWRRNESVPITHWWWYLDVLAQLPIQLEAVPLPTTSSVVCDEAGDYRCSSGETT